MLSFVVNGEIHSENLIAYYSKLFINIKSLLFLWKCLLDINFLPGESLQKTDFVLVPFVWFTFCKGKWIFILHISTQPIQPTRKSQRLIKTKAAL